MPSTPVQRTLRTCALLCGLALLFTAVCAYGCAAHTYSHGPPAPQAPSDRQTVLWAAGAYLGALLFVIGSSTLLLTISSLRRHQRTVRKAALERMVQEAAESKPE